MPSSGGGTTGRGIHIICSVPAISGGRIASAAWGRHKAVCPVLIRVDILFLDVPPGWRRWAVLVGYATIFIGPLIKLDAIGVGCQRECEGDG